MIVRSVGRCGTTGTRLILDVSIQLQLFPKADICQSATPRKEKGENTLLYVEFIFAASRLLMPKTPQVTIFSFD